MEISVARALVDLKLLKKKINKLIYEATFTDLSIGGKLKINMTQDEFATDVKATAQKIEDMINNYHKLKSAIATSNANTIVKIGDEKMTVAEAIEKKSSILFSKDFVTKLTTDYQKTAQAAEKHNQNTQMRLDALLTAAFSKDSSKVKGDEHDSVAKPYLEKNEARIIDPINIRKKVDALQEQIDAFESNVDVALSESNARTNITI